MEPVSRSASAGIGLKYRVHFAKGNDPLKAWVIEETPSKDNPLPFTRYAPAVEIVGHCRLMEMDQKATPQGWMEVEGSIYVEGTSNMVVIRNECLQHQ